MRLHRKREARQGDAARAITQAVAAGAEADERLASATEVRAGADAQAAREQRTIIAELRAMRQRNHLADMILDSVVKRGQT
jgi:hypothetical protein